MDTGYYELPPDYSSRPANNFIDTASYILLKYGNHVIYYLYINEIFAAQNTGINPFDFANKILDKYRNNVDEKENKR